MFSYWLLRGGPVIATAKASAAFEFTNPRWRGLRVRAELQQQLDVERKVSAAAVDDTRVLRALLLSLAAQGAAEQPAPPQVAGMLRQEPSAAQGILASKAEASMGAQRALLHTGHRVLWRLLRMRALAG